MESVVSGKSSQMCLTPREIWCCMNSRYRGMVSVLRGIFDASTHNASSALPSSDDLEIG